MKTIGLLVLLLGLQLSVVTPTWAQPLDSLLTLSKLNQKGNYYFRYQAKVYPETLYRGSLEAPVNSLTIRIPLLSTFEGAYIVTDQGTYDLRVDKSLSESGAAAMQNSVLLFFDQPIRHFSIYSGQIKAKIELHMMYTDPSDNARTKDKSSG